LTSEIQQKQLIDLLGEHKDCFAFKLDDLTGYCGTVGDFKLPLLHDGEIRQKCRPLGHKEKEILDEKMGELRDCGFIVPCPTGKYTQNVVIVAKKDADGNFTDSRVCVDYRPINSASAMEHYQMPTPEQLWERVGDCTVFSKIDMKSGFHQVGVAEEDQPKTAFWWGNRVWMYKRAPFGLKNIPAHFQRVMDTEIAKAGLDYCCVCYIDDILVFSRTMEQHLVDVRKVLAMLRKVGLKAHPEKSLFAGPVIEYLGHNVSGYGVTPTQAKVAAIQALPSPTSVSELRHVLGFMNYYRGYVPNFSSKAAALTGLLKKAAVWDWTAECEKAFKELKNDLSTPGLALRRFNPKFKTVVHTDWSAKGIGAVLGQYDPADPDRKEYIVACISRSLNKHERNYSSFDGETLAAVWAIKSFRKYLLGVNFDLVTDHSPLCSLLKNISLTGKHARWALTLQEYEFKVQHRPGVTHQNADVPSRFPRDDVADYVGARLDGGVASMLVASAAWSNESRGGIAQCLAQAGGDHGALSWWDAAMSVSAAGVGLTSEAVDEKAEILSAPAQVELDARRLRKLGQAVVEQAAAQLRSSKGGVTLQLQVERTPGPEKWLVHSVCNFCMAGALFSAAFREGIVVFEPFGGMCAGLEMVLRLGVRVKRYLYSDIGKAANAVAKHRVRELCMRYPHLLPGCAIKGMYQLPADVYKVDSEALIKAGALLKEQWLVVAGWECQDLSPAGSGKGLEGPRSSSFYPLVRLIAGLQMLQQARPPAYLLENTAIQCNFNTPEMAKRDFARICSVLGPPVLLDAAQFGSYAHRLRDFWTNLADPEHLQMAAAQVQVCKDRKVSDILDAGRFAAVADATDRPPYYVCNVQGEPLRAFPTLVAHPMSRAFRDVKGGVIYDNNVMQFSQLRPHERELCMGFKHGDTAYPGATDEDRCAILGKAMDMNCLQGLFAICWALWFGGWSPVAGKVAVMPPDCYEVPEQVASMAVSSKVTKLAQYGSSKATAIFREVALAGAMGEEAVEKDIWEDAAAMDFLRNGELSDDMDELQKRRVRRRARSYAWRDGTLLRVLTNGFTRIVPPPAEREALVMKTHELCGHFGQARTMHLLATTHWWKGMTRGVKNLVRSCPVCDRVKASFNAHHSTLHPLPIEGLFYRWGVDLAGPFKATSRGNLYVMICIEHFSKWVEVVPLPNKCAATTAQGFMSAVISRFGAPAEVVHDQGSEFDGEFAELLYRCFIDPRPTSANHPQADGLAERAVQTVKLALRKMALGNKNNPMEWDEQLFWVVMGYRCSVQAATKFSPYRMLYGVDPYIPPAVREKFADEVDLDDHEQAIDSILSRSEEIKRACVAAGHNLKIAQHRDTLRYAKMREGGYVPKLRKFEVGDYVYVRQRNDPYTLQPTARPYILRVSAVGKTGTLTLQGKCGRTMKVHCESCAPCHLPGIQGFIDHRRAQPTRQHPCEVCGMPDREESMLLCDGCGQGYHLQCLSPPLRSVPRGDWFCDSCRSNLVGSASALSTDPEGYFGVLADLGNADLDHDEIARARAKEFDNSVVVEQGVCEETGARKTRWGRLEFRESVPGPACMFLHFRDGGHSGPFSMDTLKVTVLHPHVEMPVPMHHIVTATVARPLGVLPDTWDVSIKSQCTVALRSLMPGQWPSQVVARISSAVPGTQYYTARAQEWDRPLLAPACVKLLNKVVDLQSFGNLVDPTAGRGNISRGLRELRLRVYSSEYHRNVVADSHEDPCQPATYKTLKDAGQLGAVVMAPWPRLVDLILPLACMFAEHAVCCHVQGVYITCPVTPRAMWLKNLQVEGRLLHIFGLPREPASTEGSGLWLCIFPSREARDRAIRPAYMLHDSTVYVS
jgi:hypothetical protein